MKLNNTQVNAITSIIYNQLKEKQEKEQKEFNGRREKLFFSKLNLKSNAKLKELYEYETSNPPSRSMLYTSVYDFFKNSLYKSEFDALIDSNKPVISTITNTNIYNQVIVSSLESEGVDDLISKIIKKFS